MRNWTLALILTLGTLAVTADSATAQLFRRGRVAYSPGYNTYYYPNYVGGYNYPSYSYSGYSYSPGMVYSSGSYITPSYTYVPSYGYDNLYNYGTGYGYNYPSYYGTRGVGVYNSPWGTGVTVGGLGWGLNIGSGLNRFAYPGFGGYRGWGGYPMRYWR